MSFSIIAAVGKKLELGKDNQLVFHIKEDMKFFKETTVGHPVLMGKNTFESIGKALPGRQNYVVTRHPEDLPDEVEAVRELKQFIEKNVDDETEIFVIGGASVYKTFLPYAKKLYLTEINADTEADAFFPEFDESKYDRKVIKKGQENDLTYTFVEYTLK